MRIIGLGEVMIRLAPPRMQRIEQARSFDIEIGGAELNTLVGLTRLGHETALVTRLPDTPLGHLVRNRIREYGVGVEHVKMIDDGRQGLCFFEFGAEPRPAEVHYDRADSAMSRIQPGEFDWKTILKGAKCLHISGITPSLSDSATAVTHEAIDCVYSLRETGQEWACVNFDINYRSKLWSREKASSVLSKILPKLNGVIASPGDASSLFGIEGPEFARLMCDRFGLYEVLWMYREQTGANRGWIQAMAFRSKVLEQPNWRELKWGPHQSDRTLKSRVHSFDIIDRIGAGDAFAAGFIHGYHYYDSFGSGVECGAIMAALKHTIPGDLPLVTKAEVEAMVENSISMGVKR